ncbi:MAG: hypothetical protein IK012_01895 [Fibrobacter sp.]|uniref:hypothetical protein n=1 Tax=Fibrobacter sp. TaxID=35828 RepID=UPI0025C24A47|nr:hypothetical protein [Fibrobacter sp.]MBR4783990.1 hypothetical protein [Fibrobacter sp.]
MRKYKLILLSLATAAFANVNDGTTETSTPAAQAVPAQQIEAPAEAAAQAPAAEVSAPVATEAPAQNAAPVIIIPAPAPAPAQAEAPAPAPAPKTIVVQEKPVVAKQANKSANRSSFFFSSNFGVRYMKLAYQSYDDLEYGYNKSGSTSRFKGFGPDIGLKFGGLIANRLAMYCTMEFGTFDGNYKANVKDYKGVSEEYDFDTDAIRFTFGGGTTLFLTNDTNSVLNGAFVGITASVFVASAGMIDPDIDALEIDEAGLAFGMEIGKVWSLGDSWSAGLVAKGSLDGTIRDGTSGNNTDCYTVGLSLVVVRK